MRFPFVRLMHIAAVSVALTLPAAPIAAVQSAQRAVGTRPLAKNGYPAPGAPPIVTVTRAGAAPRTQLRYVISANQMARFDVTMRMLMGITYGTDMLADSNNHFIPTITVNADLGVTSVEPNGDIAYGLMLSTQATRAFGTLFTSIKGAGTVSSSGGVKSMRLDTASFPMPAMLGPIFNALERLTIPFPDAAVGVGARWEVREALEVGGLTIFRPTVFQKTEYEVVSVDGAIVRLRVKTEQTGPPQLLNNPSVPVSNQQVVFSSENRLKSMSGSGTATVVVHLGSLVPVSESQSTTSIVTAMWRDGQEQGQEQGRIVDGKVKLTIAPPGVWDEDYDVKALRGIKAVSLGGSGNSTLGHDRVCLPRVASDSRGNFDDVSIAMGGLLAGARDVLQAGGLDLSPRATDHLRIDAQIHDAAECHATITLTLTGAGPERKRNGELLLGLYLSPVVWHRMFEISGPPAGFSTRVINRLKLEVRDFAIDVAQANVRK